MSSLIFWCWIKPDDGQPAAEQILLAKWNSAIQRAFALRIPAGGKLSFNLSEDGSTNDTGVITSDQPFSDGAQAHYTFVGISFSSETAIININGSNVELANLTGGGPPATIYDTPAPLILGAILSSWSPQGNFAGNISEHGFAAKAFNEAELKRIYDATKEKYGL